MQQRYERKGGPVPVRLEDVAIAVEREGRAAGV
jgi:hypothetical protein